MRLPSHDDVRQAQARLEGRVVRTPLLRNEALDRQTGGTILVKPEPLQRTGSFKLRGATNALRRLPDAGRRRGVVTYSSGNHGQAIACAAASLGMPATIYMPADAPRTKVESTRRWGAEIIHYDREADDREALARAHAERSGAALLPPYDHPDVIAGQGTLALELFADAAAAGLSVDMLLVPVGGGGLIAGCALAAEEAAPAAQVIAAEPEGWDDTARSLAAGTRLSARGRPTRCDALLARMPGELTFAINRPRLAGGVAVSEEEVLHAIACAFRHLKLVVEPGGAVALAAVLAGCPDPRGKVVGVVLSGGNIDPAVFREALDAAG